MMRSYEAFPDPRLEGRHKVGQCPCTAITPADDGKQILRAQECAWAARYKEGFSGGSESGYLRLEWRGGGPSLNYIVAHRVHAKKAHKHDMDLWTPFLARGEGLHLVALVNSWPV